LKWRIHNWETNNKQWQHASTNASELAKVGFLDFSSVAAQDLAGAERPSVRKQNPRERNDRPTKFGLTWRPLS